MSSLQSQLTRPILRYEGLFLIGGTPSSTGGRVESDGQGSLRYLTVSHTLETGDVVYRRARYEETYRKRYAIRISNTEFKIATSVSNAANGVTESATPTDEIFITTGLLDGGADFFGGLLSPTVASWNPSAFKPNFPDANAKSSVSFNINSPVTLDWVYPAQGRFDGGNVVGLTTSDESVYVGLLSVLFAGFIVGGTLASGYNPFTPPSGITSTSGYRGRISITADRRISIAVALLNTTTYTTLWTSSQMSSDLAPLFFYSSFTYAGQTITNCTITYPTP